MSLSFNPLSEEEVLNLIEPGIYHFEVKEATEGFSQGSGMPRIALIVKVWDKNGREKIIFDYLTTSLLYKIKHFCDATGLEKVYESGKFSASDCTGKSGKCKIKIDSQEGYQPKNSVADYVAADKDVVEMPLSSFKSKDELTDDDIPF
jgi:hypothetical protein